MCSIAFLAYNFYHFVYILGDNVTKYDIQKVRLSVWRSPQAICHYYKKSHYPFFFLPFIVLLKMIIRGPYHRSHYRQTIVDSKWNIYVLIQFFFLLKNVNFAYSGL